MKFILKNGKEYEIESIGLNYGAEPGTPDAMTFNVIVRINGQPDVLVKDISHEFTAENLSKVTTIDNAGGSENISEFSFCQLTNIALNITDKTRAITVTLK